jgi:uncharacterized OsmC-like protein
MRPEIIEETIATWTKEPDQARSTPTVTARAEDGQALIQAGPFAWRADLPAPLGGTNQAPSPTALLLSALAGCAVAFVQDTLGPQLGMRIKAVEATVQCDTDARGLLGMDGAEPDLRNVTLDVSVESPDGEAGVAEIARVWQERCPIYLALQKPTDVGVRFSAA